jgi:hypothetical protein
MHRRVLLGAALASLAASIALSFVVSADRPRVQVDAEALLADAQEKSTFLLRLPSELPAGFELVNVIYNRSEVPGDPTFSVDLYYEDSSGTRLHIWQSNHASLGDEDPVRDPRGQSVDLLDSQEWTRLDLEFGNDTLYILSTRYTDGVTLSLDLANDYQSLTRVAESLR